MKRIEIAQEKIASLIDTWGITGAYRIEYITEAQAAKTRAETLKEVWEVINAHGISIFGHAIDEPMNVTVSYGRTVKLSSSIIFTRPSADGILFWLSDKEWQALKAGKSIQR